jgi:hypothetical protein
MDFLCAGTTLTIMHRRPLTGRFTDPHLILFHDFIHNLAKLRVNPVFGIINDTFSRLLYTGCKKSEIRLNALFCCVNEFHIQGVMCNLPKNLLTKIV